MRATAGAQPKSSTSLLPRLAEAATDVGDLRLPRRGPQPDRRRLAERSTPEI